MTAESRGVLLSLLEPETTVEAFFRDVWQQRAYESHGRPDRFANLFDHVAFERALGDCEGLKASSHDARGWPVETPIGRVEARAAYERGATVCLSSIRNDPRLDRFRRGFATDVRHAGEPCFNCYYSPDGHGFGLHLDDHPVFILQIEGRKRWRYSTRPGVAHPLTTITFAPGVALVQVPWRGAIARPDESAFAETILEPGDVLYLPEGTWHSASAIGSSLALTLAIDRATPLDLVQQAVLARVAECPSLRFNLPGVTAAAADAAVVPPELREPLEDALQRLRQIVGDLRAEDLYRVWQQLAATHEGR
jgi:hypothetical protein